MKNGGRILVESLAAHGVKRIYCVPGESYLEILDALYDSDIAVVSCRHESGAAFMAEAEAKLSGRLGVAMATRGPGACNAAIGVHTAFQDSTPLLLLLGDVARPHRGREAFQEVDFERMFAPLAKAVERVDSAARLPEIMARAIHTALSGRPGPVVLALPEDMLREEAAPAAIRPLSPTRAHPVPDMMAELHSHLRHAQKPFLIVGGGGWNAVARRAVGHFASANQLPVACTFRRHDLIDNNHPGFAGDLGIAPDPALVKRVQEADLLIILGARLGEIASQGYTLLENGNLNRKIVHIHASAEEPGRVFTPDLAIQSGMAEFLSCALELPFLPEIPWSEWTAEAALQRRKWSEPRSTGGALDLGLVMGDLAKLLPKESIVTTDAGNFAGWPQRFLKFHRLLGPTCGAMGYGVPAAVSASLSAPEACVVCFVGDGGCMMTGQELATALQQGTKPIILIFNNRQYGTIRMHQESRFPGRVMATELHNPHFAEWAASFGAYAERVERTEEFAPAFTRALASGKASVIELMTDPEILSPRATVTELRSRGR
jgi:acetolactate synthase-1/2/3 large subunit